MSDEAAGPMGRNEVALGGVLAVMLLGGLFFLYRSLIIEPEPAPVGAPITTVQQARPTPRPTVADGVEPSAPPPPTFPLPGASGGGSGAAGAPTVGGEGSTTARLPTARGQQNPWLVSGSARGGRGLGSGGDASGGGFLGGE
ncbi:MAG: hypothetical protein ACI8PZ_004391 [Myxococcota bacterium]|jgi:hypothetical protein